MPVLQNFLLIYALLKASARKKSKVQALQAHHSVLPNVLLGGHTRIQHRLCGVLCKLIVHRRNFLEIYQVIEECGVFDERKKRTGRPQE